MIGSTEIIIIVLIIFVLFGAKSLPKFAKSLGEARKELKKGFDEVSNDDQSSTDKHSNTKTS